MTFRLLVLGMKGLQQHQDPSEAPALEKLKFSELPSNPSFQLKGNVQAQSFFID
jgi:hypothetical protein